MSSHRYCVAPMRAIFGVNVCTINVPLKKVCHNANECKGAQNNAASPKHSTMGPEIWAVLLKQTSPLINEGNSFKNSTVPFCPYSAGYLLKGKSSLIIGFGGVWLTDLNMGSQWSTPAEYDSYPPSQALLHFSKHKAVSKHACLHSTDTPHLFIISPPLVCFLVFPVLWTRARCVPTASRKAHMSCLSASLAIGDCQSMKFPI